MSLKEYQNLVFKQWIDEKHPMFMFTLGVLIIIMALIAVISVICAWFFVWWWKLLLTDFVAYAAIQFISQIIVDGYKKEYLLEQNK